MGPICKGVLFREIDLLQVRTLHNFHAILLHLYTANISYVYHTTNYYTSQSFFSKKSTNKSTFLFYSAKKIQKKNISKKTLKIRLTKRGKRDIISLSHYILKAMTERVRCAKRHREPGGILRGISLEPGHESKAENHSQAARVSQRQPLPDSNRYHGVGSKAYPCPRPFSMQVVTQAPSSVPDTDRAFFNLRHFFS